MMVCIVPSRGRPGNIAALLEAWADTLSDGGFMTLAVAVDDDDPHLDEYRKVMTGAPRWAGLWIDERRRLGGTLNHLAPMLAGINGSVGFMGDDHRPRTKDWDKTIAEACVRGAVVYGNDLIQGSALPTAVFLDSTIVRTLGYFVPPGATHLYLDNYWKLLGERLGTLRYLPEVVIEHVHPIAGKAAWDDGYAEVNSDEMYDADRAVFNEWVAFQMPEAIAKIRQAVACG